VRRSCTSSSSPSSACGPLDLLDAHAALVALCVAVLVTEACTTCGTLLGVTTLAPRGAHRTLVVIVVVLVITVVALASARGAPGAVRAEQEVAERGGGEREREEQQRAVQRLPLDDVALPLREAGGVGGHWRTAAEQAAVLAPEVRRGDEEVDRDGQEQRRDDGSDLRAGRETRGARLIVRVQHDRMLAVDSPAVRCMSQIHSGLRTN